MNITIPANAGTYRYWTQNLIADGRFNGVHVRRAKWADLAAQSEARFNGEVIPGEIVGTYPNRPEAMRAIAEHAAADRAE